MHIVYDMYTMLMHASTIIQQSNLVSEGRASLRVWPSFQFEAMMWTEATLSQARSFFRLSFPQQHQVDLRCTKEIRNNSEIMPLVLSACRMASR